MVAFLQQLDSYLIASVFVPDVDHAVALRDEVQFFGVVVLVDDLFFGRGKARAELANEPLEVHLYQFDLGKSEKCLFLIEWLSLLVFEEALDERRCFICS